MKSIISKAAYWLILLGMIMPWGLEFGVSTAEAHQLHTTATLIAENQSIQPGVSFWVGLHMKMEDGWKTYWENPGEAGLPTEIKWELPEGFTVDALQWPKPEVVMLEGIVGYGYKGEALILAKVTPPENLSLSSEVTLKGKVQWLECDELCIPGSADVSLTLPVSIAEPVANVASAELFVKTREQVPQYSNIWVPLVYIDGTNMLIWMKPKAGVPIHVPDPKSVYFYSLDRGVTELGLQQTVELYGDGLLLRIPLNPNATEPVDAMVGVLYSPDGWNGERTVTSIEVRAHVQGGALPVAKTSSGLFANTGSSLTIIFALASAFVGGLILNLMPCVFPVLGLKVLSFVSHAKEDKWVLRMHGIVFAAGVIISFWCLSGLLLGLRAMGQELGWGFQLQTPGFIAFLVILLFVMGLNFAGVFEIGQSVMGVGSKLSQKQGYGGSFFSGVLATLVATPCTAPFMGAALGFALAQPPFIALMIFTCLGVGMSTPYLVLTFVPMLMKWMPRPGAWMETFKVVMAFPLWATVIWLLWVFALQTGPNAQTELMFALLIIALGCWIYGRWSAPYKEKKTRWMGYAATGVCAGLALMLAVKAQTETSSSSAYGSESMNATAQEMAWLAYSDDVVNELRGKGQAVYVDFTAAWCLTCQANKKVVFSSEEVIDTFKQRNIATVRADWTKRDPRITTALEKFGRTGVPLNVLYPADPNAEPIILPATLTPGAVLEAVDAMHSNKSS